MKARVTWRLCLVSETQSKPTPSTTGILTFSLKGHQSFHVFTSTFNVRWKEEQEKEGEVSEMTRGRETGFKHGPRWTRTENTRSKREKRPKRSAHRPRSELWGTYPHLLSHTDTDTEQRMGRQRYYLTVCRHLATCHCVLLIRNQHVCQISVPS